MKKLPDRAYAKLIQLLGMIGSDHDGEVLNAARLARRLVKEHGLSLHEVLGGEDVNGSASTHGGAANRAAGGKGYQEGYEEGLQKGAELAAAAVRAEYSRGFHDGVNNAKSIGLKADRSWKDWAQDRIDNDSNELSDWETNFFGDFSNGRYATPTDKQRGIFERVGRRLGISLPGAANGYDDV